MLRATANNSPADETSMARVVDLARSNPVYELSWTQAGLFLTCGEDDAAAVISHHLARATFDLLLSAPTGVLRACAGGGCLKVFISSRSDRRWCDSKVCGNRARVSRHSARHSHVKREPTRR